MRLSPATAGLLPRDVVQPAYDRHEQRSGIVHLGVGAFHRAHQAVYTDAAMAAGDRDWAITGVSLRAPDVRAALEPQDWLYTVTERDIASDRRAVIGALREVLVAPEAREAAIAALASPDTRVVTITVTEKGYHLGPDGALDLHAIERAGQRSIYDYLAAAFALRVAAGLPGLTLISCDNLADNGATLRHALQEFLERHQPKLEAWFAAECACPSTMVDRIVPATSPAKLDEIEAALGMRDEAAVITEPFQQWIIENRFAGARPRWQLAGARFVDDVRPYETAKLRMLNGAHSALAYLGLAAGHAFVHQAVSDPAIRQVAERLMRVEAAGGLPAGPHLKLDEYADALFVRFGNAALPHRLSQIAADGSQKIPQRWLASLAANRGRGRTCPATLTALAAWMLHVRGDNGPVEDPMAGTLHSLWKATDPADVSRALFGEMGMFSTSWVADQSELDTLTAIQAPHARAEADT